MKVYIHLVDEIPFIHEMMDKADLTDNGRKIYAQRRDFTVDYKKDSEEDFVRCVETVCFKEIEELNKPDGRGKPVFVLAASDNKHTLVYFRKGVNQISDGKISYMFDDYLRQWFDVQVDELRRVISVGYTVNGKFVPIECYKIKLL